MSKNILVTGGAGFIGSHTVDLLVLRGHNVTVLDNLSTGKQKNVNKKAKFILMDVLNIDASKLRDIDAVLHCAAQISVGDSLKDPVNDANINIIGSLRVLEICRKFDIKKFVFASSAGVYGNNLKSMLPISEGHNEKLGNPYAIAKRSAEKYMEFYRKMYGIDCLSLRYSNVYGPRQNYLGEAGVVTIFINGLLRNQRPVIFGDGKQTRDFVYVEDVANCNLRALNQKTSFNEINAGTANELSVNGLLSAIERLMGKKIKPIHREKRKGEVRFSSLNADLAKKELGWRAKTGIEEGLKKTIDWFSSREHNHL